MMLAIVVTGASGFLGQALLEAAATQWPNATLVPIHSPRRGGIDLAHADAPMELAATIRISRPHETVLIHAAAAVEWHSPAGFVANAAMAVNVGTWAKSADIGFSVLVSGVNVNPSLPMAGIHASCDPPTLYGLGKWAAERVWSLLLPPGRSSVVRLAGIWGWQCRPTLFWNQILLAAVRGSPLERLPVVRRKQSRRNYISVHEASECLLQIGANRMSGLFLSAGRDVVSTKSFVDAVQELPASKLSVDWQDDRGTDEAIYDPSPELLPWLKSFPEVLLSVWANKPTWVAHRP